MANPIVPKEISDNPIEEESKKLENWFKIIRNISALIIGIFFIILVCCFTWEFPFNINWPIAAERWGQFGDFFGGVIGTLITYLSILFLYKAYKEQRLANIESHETNSKISQQNKDLSLIETKHLYNEQLQQFENKFNRLLMLYQEAISCYNDLPLVKNNKAHFEDKITNYLINASSPISKSYRNRVTEASKTFEVFLQLHRQQVSNHMRLLFQILYLLECEDIKSKDRIYYAKVFRSQLTDKELILIRYNCLSNREEKMRLPVFHFNILKFLPLMDLLEFSEYRKYLDPQQINILNDELIGIRKKIYNIFNNNYYERKKNNKWEFTPNYELSVSISKDNQSYLFALKKARNHSDGRNEPMADFFDRLPESLLISFIIDFNEEIFKYSNFKIFNRNCKHSYRNFNFTNYIFYTVSIKNAQPIIVSNLQIERPTSTSQ